MKSLPRMFALRMTLFLSTLTFLISNTTAAQAGTLDPDFGTGGRVTTNVTQYDTPRQVYVLADGKILVAGQTANQTTQTYAPSPVLIRYLSNGTLDSSFGNGGIVDGAMGNIEIRDTALQPDGKIVLVGGINPGVNLPPQDFALVRYNSNGTLDTSFGTNGVVITAIGGSRDAAAAIVLLPDGKLFVAGTTKGTTDSPGTINLVRYNSDGTLDATFGAGGIIYYFIGQNNSSPDVYDVVLLPDGKLLMAANWGGRFLARFNSDGSYDTSFGSNGIRPSPLVAGEITLQPDGKFMIPTTVYNSSMGANVFAISRYNSDGTNDNSFGDAGRVYTVFRAQNNDNASAAAFHIILKSNGEFIALGAAHYINGNDTSAFAAAHYRANGSIIARTTISFPQSPFSAAIRGAIQADGKIVLAGTVEYTGTGSDVAVARLTSITNDFTPYRKTYDFNGDFKDDLITYMPGTGGSSSQWFDFSFFHIVFVFGLGEDLIAPADYTGDRIADLAVFRPSTGTWYIANSLVNPGTNFTAIQWGTSGDIPVASDYDGDAKADVAVFRPSNGVWYILNSQSGSHTFVQWGLNGDKPVAGDYDGDNRADAAVYRPSTRVWYVLRSSDGQIISTQFGATGDLPVAADYDGDGRMDIAVWRPSNGAWYVLQSSNGLFVARPWGQSGDIPVPGDYDGDGKTDFAIWRSNVRGWYIRNSSDGSATAQEWGYYTDIPVPGN